MYKNSLFSSRPTQTQHYLKWFVVLSFSNWSRDPEWRINLLISASWRPGWGTFLLSRHSTVLYSPSVKHTASLCTWHEWYETIRALTPTNKRAESHLQCRGGSSYTAKCAFTKNTITPKKGGRHSRLDSLRLNNNIQQILRISISNLQT